MHLKTNDYNISAAISSFINLLITSHFFPHSSFKIKYFLHISTYFSIFKKLRAYSEQSSLSHGSDYSC